MRLLTLALALLPALAHAADVRVEADRLVVEDGVARGEGAVRLASGDEIVTGATITVDLASRTAEVTDGTWTGPRGALSFAHATLDLAAGTGSVDGATFVSGALRLEGSRLEVHADGTITGERVQATLCDCDGVEPWGVQARHVEVEPGEVVRFRGGAVRVLGAPVLPVPFGSVPLSRRSGFLAPVAGYGPDGVRLATPLYLTLGRPADLTLTPEIRTLRSARLLAEQRYALAGGGGTTELAGGWDAWDAAWRGGARWSHGWARGAWAAATQGLATSDLDYSADYADGFLARQQPWNEARALVGTRSVELGADLFQADTPVTQRVAALGLHRPDAEIFGGVMAGGSLDGALLAGPDGLRPDIRAELRAYKHVSLGPLDVVPGVRARSLAAAGTLDLDPAPPRSATGSVLVRLPMWRTAGEGYERLEPTLEVEQVLLTVAEGPDGPLLDPLVGRPWLKPGLLWRRTAGDGVVEARAAAVDRDPDGWRYEISAWAQRGPWSARLEARTRPLSLQSPDLRRPIHAASAALRADLGPLDVDAALVAAVDDAIRADRDLAQGRLGAGWTLPGDLATVRLGGALFADATTREWLSRTATIRWTHPSGCLALGANARFDVDRALPDVAFTLDVAP